jgi:catechol 2,3-dioxygenase-like lactoylglutathione lyase family enzyme
MLKGFHHAALSTPDLDRLVAWYRAHFGCSVVREFGWPAGIAEADAVVGLENSAARAVMLRLKDSHLEVFEFSSPTPRPASGDRPAHDHGISHICLEVQDCRGEYERLKAAGMRFHCPPQAQDGGWVTYGRDCDGNIVELLEFGSGS